MKILLDTHILLWAITNDIQLPENAKKMILNEDNDIFCSVVSVLEVQLKHIAHLDSLPIDGERFLNYCRQSGFSLLHLKCSPIFLLKTLERYPGSPSHKDPFDRLLICQAVDENMIFITHDKLLGDYNVPNIIKV